MKTKLTHAFRYLIVIGMIYGSAAKAVDSPISGTGGTNNMGGQWDSLTLSGSLAPLSSALKDFRWQVMDQTRLRDDSSKGYRFTENLLFAQLGYSFTQHSSFWLGYVHDWIHPLDKPSYQESRPYQDFLCTNSFGDLKLMSRSRLEERINQVTGNTGVRGRQLLQISYPLHFIDDALSVYLGDEVLGYLNTNKFGPTGFSENRALAGVSYQFTKQLGADLGYLGQYIVVKPGPDLFTHNVQLNLRYQF